MPEQASNWRKKIGEAIMAASAGWDFKIFAGDMTVPVVKNKLKEIMNGDDLSWTVYRSAVSEVTRVLDLRPGDEHRKTMNDALAIGRPGGKVMPRS